MKTALTIVFIILCVALIVMILMQEGKQAGFGATLLSGSSDGYWTKIKSRSKEGKLVRYTTVGIILFFVLAIVLCLI